MTTQTIKLLIVVFVTGLFACNSQSKTINGNKEVIVSNTPHNADNSMNLLDWDGDYYGILPCADCEGIETTITLSKNLTFKNQASYLGKLNAHFSSTGTFSWNDKGKIITFNNNEKSIVPNKFMVGENKLTQLDLNGNIITGALAEKYQLKKVQSEITEKYWKLIEIKGSSISSEAILNKEPHLIIKKESRSISGNGGCNAFFGSYELKEGNQISFSKIGATEMACLNMEIEMELFKVLNMADNYSIKDDTLALNKAKMATLARFVVVYLK